MQSECLRRVPRFACGCVLGRGISAEQDLFVVRGMLLCLQDAARQGSRLKSVRSRPRGSERVRVQGAGELASPADR